MKLVLHGYLRKYMDTFQVEARSVAEALEGLFAQVPKPVNDRHRVQVIDFDTEEKLRSPTDQGEVHVVPQLAFSKSKWMQILIGGAMIAAAFVLPGSVAIFGQEFALATGVAAMGVGMVLGGLAQILAPAPHKANPTDPSAYLPSNQNTTENGTAIPLGYGLGPAYGQILSVNVDAKDILQGKFPA